MTALTSRTLHLSPDMTFSREQFYRLCEANPERKLERNPDGKLIVMAPTGGETGYRNSELNADLVIWNRQEKEGRVCDSSTGFSLPEGGDRSPDVSWIPLEKWESLTPKQRQGFLPLCPDFVIELLSPSDTWNEGMEKMEEYQKNGCRLGWLLDPKKKQVGIYRGDRPVEILEAPDKLFGEDVLIGFELNVRFLWQS